MDPKKLVAAGYDRLCGAYERWGAVGTDHLRHAYIDRVIALGLHPPADALDLGCNTGSHATAYLVERGFTVTGVDISPACIKVAARTIVSGQFLAGDMTTIELPAASFDLVTAFYSIIHVPRQEHASLSVKIRSWLRPGGFLIVAIGGSEEPDEPFDASWLGRVPMYWSNWDATTNRRLIREAGLDIVESQIESTDEDGRQVHFLWVIARRPTGSGPDGCPGPRFNHEARPSPTSAGRGNRSVLFPLPVMAISPARQSMSSKQSDATSPERSPRRDKSRSTAKARRP